MRTFLLAVAVFALTVQAYREPAFKANAHPSAVSNAPLGPCKDPNGHNLMILGPIAYFRNFGYMKGVQISIQVKKEIKSWSTTSIGLGIGGMGFQYSSSKGKMEKWDDGGTISVADVTQSGELTLLSAVCTKCSASLALYYDQLEDLLQTMLGAPLPMAKAFEELAEKHRSFF